MNRQTLKRAGLLGLRLALVPAVLRRINRSRASIVTYHGFTLNSSLDGVNSHLHMFHDEFERQLGLFAKHHQVVPLQELAAAQSGYRASVGNRIGLTSDDGYRSVYEIAYPLLQKHSLCMTVFLVSDFVDGVEFLWHDRIAYCLDSMKSSGAGAVDISSRESRIIVDVSTRESLSGSARAIFEAAKSVNNEQRQNLVASLERESGYCLGSSGPVPREFAPLKWSQVNEMRDSGLVSFGSHTKTHSIMTRCSDAEVQSELMTSKTRIEAETGAECDSFCYPNGTYADISDHIGSALEQCGYRSACTTIPGMVKPDSSVFALPRFSSNRPLEVLELKVAGLG